MLLLFLATSALLVHGNVPSLTDNNFKDFLKDNEKVLVEFYAPWCGHCKHLEPELHGAGEVINDNDEIPAKIVQVDATENSETASKYDVKGYPTIKWFEGGEVAEDYNGERNKDGIVSWVKSRVLPIVQKISGKKAADFGKDSDYAIVAYVKAGSKKEALYEKACKKIRKAFEKLVPLEITCAQVSLKKGNGRFYFRRNKFNEAVDGPVELKYEGKIGAMKDFIFSNMWGLVTRGVKAPVITSTESEGFLLIHGDKDDEDLPEGVAEVAKTLREENRRVAFMEDSDATMYQMPSEPSYLYLAKNEKAKGRENFMKYLLDPEEDETSLADFVTKAKAGDWARHYKSEDPVDNEGEDVLTFVGSNFEEEAYDENTDTLIEFYAPWCGHCKKFVPVYEKFAKYANRLYKGKVRIAKINADDNEVDADVGGFPTIMFFPGGPEAAKRTSYKFQGTRDDRDDLMEFIEDHSYFLNEGKDEL